MPECVELPAVDIIFNYFFNIFYVTEGLLGVIWRVSFPGLSRQEAQAGMSYS